MNDQLSIVDVPAVKTVRADAALANRFEMQSWRSRTEGWERMQDGAAARVWRPRTTGAEAIQKCIAWTGGLGVPAMQVVDLTSGEVVWRDSHAYPAAGPCINHEEEGSMDVGLYKRSGGDTSVCEFCEEPLDDSQPSREGLDGAQAHEACLEEYIGDGDAEDGPAW